MILFSCLSCGVVLFNPDVARAQWIEKPGHGWVQISLYHHDTRDRFDAQKRKVPLFNEDGRSITTSLILTGAVGVIHGVDVWGQVPVHRLSFNDIVADRTSFGAGDPSIFLRIGPELIGLSPSIPVAIRGGTKLSLGSFPIDSEVVPLTEGQQDWELLLELGYSFYPSPIYVSGWVGYRWREKNEEIERKPGNERILYFAIGGNANSFVWKLAAEGLWGEQWVSFTGGRIELAQSERQLFQLTPTVGWRLGMGQIELGSRIPLTGKNLPAGPALFAGFFYRWGA